MGNIYIETTKGNSRNEENEEKQVQEDENSNNKMYKGRSTQLGNKYKEGEQENIYLGSSKALYDLFKYVPIEIYFYNINSRLIIIDIIYLQIRYHIYHLII